jgi:hypothetical protein
MRAAALEGRRSATKGLLAMPIRQYFSWVGSVLLVALFAADWWLPGPAAHSPSAIPSNEKVNLRIRSDHKWPERVVFDTAIREDAFAAMEEAQVTPTATNEKASAIRAKPRTLGPRMTGTIKTD